jgi:hypothetical protein
MCNEVCVGLRQFFEPIFMIVGFAVGAHLVFAVLSAIGNSFDQNRRRRRAECDRTERLRRDLTRPLIEVEAARQSLQEVGNAYVDGDFSRPTWQMQYLDCIIAVRTGNYAEISRPFFREQYRVFHQLKRKAARQATLAATFAATKAHVQAWF